MGAPQITEESLNRVNLRLFWLKKRKKDIGNWLTFDEWHRLNELINTYAPHLMVTISRRIPRLPRTLGMAFGGPKAVSSGRLKKLLSAISSRLHGLARAIDLAFGGRSAGEELTIITDLAIPWSAGRLKRLAKNFTELKVALLDDSFGTGVTHGYVKDQLLLLLPKETTELKCFVIARKVLNDGRTTDVQSDGDQFRCEDVISIKELNERLMESHSSEPGNASKPTYREFTRQMPRALMMLPKPFEIEYPILQFKYGAINLAAEAEPTLDEFFGKNNVHRLSTSFMENTGLARYSIDVAPGSGFNYKIRVFFDDGHRECRIMAHAPDFFILPDSLDRVKSNILKDLPPEMKNSKITEPKAKLKMELFRKDAEARLKFFMSSLAFGLLALKVFENFLVIDGKADPFSYEEASHLFGPECEKYWRGLKLGRLREETACAAKKSDASHDDSLEAMRRLLSKGGRHAECSPFWKSALKEGCGELLAEVRKKTVGQGVNFQCFQDFFYVLDKWARNYDKEEPRLVGQGLNNDGFPSTEQFELYAPLRRKVGPTFFDLMKIMEQLWACGETTHTLSPEDLHNEVSYHLDCCVDDGFVVPTISPIGERIYRKGESDAHNREIARFYKLFNLNIEPDRFFDLAKRESFKELSDEEADLMRYAIKNSDTL